MSDIFEWDARTLGLGIPEIDGEHQQIIQSMNRLYHLSQSGSRGPQLGQAYDNLAAVTVKHFKDEEAYMAKIGFPDVRKHSLVHKQLLDRLGQFKSEFDKTGVFGEEFFMFLKMWLKAHICGIDTKYAQHVNAA